MSQAQLTTTLTAAQLAAATTVPILVRSGAGNDSGALTFAVQNPQPTVSTFVPASQSVGAASFNLTINGTNFVSGVQVDFGTSTGLAPTTQTTTQLVVPITTAMLGTTPGTPAVTVRNPTPNAGNAQTTYSVNAGAPTLLSISPVLAAANGPAFTLTANGTRFYAGSTIVFDGTSLATTFVSDAQITASVPASQLTAARMLNVTVSNGTSGITSPQSFTVQNSATTVTALLPSSASVGASSVTMTISGSGFATGALVDFGATTGIVPTSISASTINVTIPGAALGTTPGPVNLVVRNPAPNAGNGSMTFTVNPGVPVLTLISPDHATLGSGDTSIRLTGSGFYSQSQASFAGIALSTTFVSSTTLTAIIPAALLTKAGNVNVTVGNQTWGTSGILTFAVQNPAPTVASLNPPSSSIITKGFTLTISGSFVNPATVTLGGTAMTIQAQSATQIVATVNSTMTPDTGGPVAVVVSNPAPAVGTGTATFYWTNPPPLLTWTGQPMGLVPDRAPAGAGTNLTLTVNGTYFTRTSVAYADTTPLATTYVGMGQLTASLPRSAIPRIQRITVQNPQVNGLGGGTSAPGFFSFTGWQNRTQTPGNFVPPTLAGASVVQAFGYVNVLFGLTSIGSTTPTDYMYRYDVATSTWVQPVKLTGYGRWKAAAAFDEFNQRILVFGGEISAGTAGLVPTNQLLMIDASNNVTFYPPAGVQVFAPGPNADPAFAYDGARRRAMVTSGGGSTYFWEGTRWTTEYTPYAPSNVQQRMACDTNAAECYIQGGASGSTYVSATYRYNRSGASTDWQALHISPEPGARGDHAFLINSDNGSQVVFAGWTGLTPYLVDLWHRITTGWAAETLAGAPTTTRYLLGSTFTSDLGGVFAFYGGQTPGAAAPSLTNELWTLVPDAELICPVLNKNGLSATVNVPFATSLLNNQWVSTNIFLSPCQEYTIRVTNPTAGFVTCQNGTPTTNAKGIPTTNSDCPNVFGRDGALVGTIQATAPTTAATNQFLTGIGPTTRQGRGAYGTLYLSVDTFPNSPAGSYTVQIDY